MDTVVVGARGSRLAQAMVAEFLTRLGGPCPVVKFKNRVVMTDGDRDRKSSLREVSGASGSGSGAFSNQLGQELLEGRIDIAVAPSNPNYIYAQVQAIAPNSNGGCGTAPGCQLGAYRSIDGGATWYSLTSLNNLTSALSFGATQSDYI